MHVFNFKHVGSLHKLGRITHMFTVSYVVEYIHGTQDIGIIKPLQRFIEESPNRLNINEVSLSIHSSFSKANGRWK